MTPDWHEPTAEPVRPSMRRPYYRDGEVTLHTGDATEVLATFPAGSVDCVVTSPPYWGLRDYGTAVWTGGDPSCPHPAGGNARPAHLGAGPGTCPGCGAVRTDRQYGLEATAAGYVEHLRGVFAELARVLAPSGTVWLNLGDSYSSNSDGYDTTAPGKPNQPNRRPRKPVGFKNLVGMPWRVAFALQDDGWILRNAIVWHKPNGMPESVTDRMTCTYELVFLLVRSRRYWLDLDPVRVPLARPDALGGGVVIGGAKGRHAGVGATARRRGRTVYGAKYTDTPTVNAAFTTAPGPAMRPGRPHDRAHPRGKNPGDVWSIPTRPLRAAHFAAFPIDLPLRCIAAGCPPGGVVLDPFSGAATTGLAARQLGRRYHGIDLNPAFHSLALDRLGLPRPDTGAQADTDPNQDGNAA